MKMYRLTRKRDGAHQDYDVDAIARFLLHFAGGGYTVQSTARAMELQHQLDDHGMIESPSFRLEVINDVNAASEVQATPR